MSNLRCIAEHTVDLSLLKRDSKVLDLGCRVFSWSKAMLEYVDKVYCVDADPDVKSDDPRLPIFHGAVLQTPFNQVHLKRSGNGTANRVYQSWEQLPRGEFIHVTSTTIDYLTSVCGRERQEVIEATQRGEFPPSQFFDLIKIDIEGSEIPVLDTLQKPPAKQLSVEFHMHTGTLEIDIIKVFDHLGSIGYEKIFTDKSEKHGCGMNYWDVLFILKDKAV